MRPLPLLIALALAGCGVAGPPEPPEPPEPRAEPGVTISGTVKVGVSGSSR